LGQVGTAAILCFQVADGAVVVRGGRELPPVLASLRFSAPFLQKKSFTIQAF